MHNMIAYYERPEIRVHNRTQKYAGRLKLHNIIPFTECRMKNLNEDIKYINKSVKYT